MFIRRAVTALSLCTVALTAPTEKRSVDFNWGSETIRGVNIGGWLVLEPWITPSVFDKANEGRPQRDIVDEYTLGEKLGHDAALAVLRKHWDTFTTWHDFKKIKDAGFNIVRIPIGYWAYDTFDSPYVDGAKVYIDAAIDWSRSLGLKIMIDLHGAPGSQNGYDNSGQRLDVPKWQSGETVKQTLQVLKTISDQYAQEKYQDVIIGIQLLNEPAMYFDNISEDVTRQFYRDGFYQVRDTSDTTVILHDGFIRPNQWNGYLTPSDNNAQNVAVDHHEYQVFDNSLIQLKPSEHNHKVCDLADAYGGADKWTFVGEWSGAMTDCAKYLNGLGRGARYNGTHVGAPYQGDCSFANDFSKWDETRKDDVRKYIETQIHAFEAKTQGWVFWNFKTENAFEWDALALVDAGIFPAIRDGQVEYKFPKVCTNFY